MRSVPDPTRPTDPDETDAPGDAGPVEIDPSVRLIQVGFKGHRIDLCTLPEAMEVAAGLAVVVEADRGIDIGRVMRTGLGALKPNSRRPLRAVLRPATQEEVEQLARLREEEPDALHACRKRVAASGLPMMVVDAEWQFDRNRITFYFTAEGRIDFRLLVRELAKIFKTRIELRQIHPRESARRQAGVGPCGRPLCCSTFLQSFEPVTLRMAKRQHLALAPTRISGLCGRLLCCLTFEREVECCGQGGMPCCDPRGTAPSRFDAPEADGDGGGDRHGGGYGHRGGAGHGGGAGGSGP